MTITTDPKKFQQELRELYVQVGSEVEAAAVVSTLRSSGPDKSSSGLWSYWTSWLEDLRAVKNDKKGLLANSNADLLEIYQSF